MSALDAWLEQRELLNHDLLRNKVILTLDTTILHDQQSVLHCGRALRMFLARQASFEELLDTAPANMAPGAWLVMWLAGRVHASDHGDRWRALAELTDALFLSTSSVIERCRTARARLVDAVACAAAVVGKVDAHGYLTAEDRREAQLAALALSEALSALPRDAAAVVATMRA